MCQKTNRFLSIVTFNTDTGMFCTQNAFLKTEGQTKRVRVYLTQNFITIHTMRTHSAGLKKVDGRNFTDE